MWLDTDILECDLKGDLINVQRIINQILKWKSEIKVNKISEIELSMIESKGNV